MRKNLKGEGMPDKITLCTVIESSEWIIRRCELALFSSKSLAPEDATKFYEFCSVLETEKKSFSGNQAEYMTMLQTMMLRTIKLVKVG